MNKISILHISDLHKDDDDSYADLLSSLIDDIDNCKKNNGIKKPDMIVVSGDVIRGAVGDNADNEIKTQYEQVASFLESLVLTFLGGDKRKIIIVPGNHDINREISKKSMVKIEQSTNSHNLISELFREKSAIRWCWNDLHFYKINDIPTYNKRFYNFIEFFNTFYDGIYAFPLAPEEQSILFNINEYNIVFIGFNSCCDLDHLNTSGKIHPTSLSRLSLKVKELHNRGNLLVGVWHHHTAGAPFESNYLDKRILSAMIDRHIHLGIHGHQHISEIANEFKNCINGDSLFLISAGTLYGKQKELPYKAGRQYNIIEIEMNSSVKVTVHSREDEAKDLFAIPSWGDGRIGGSQSSKIEFEIPRPPLVDVETAIDNILKDTGINNDLSHACDRLLGLGVDRPIVRQFLLDFLVKDEDYVRIYETFLPIKNVVEAIEVLNAVISLNDVNKMKEVLKDKYILSSSDSSVRTLRFEVERLIKK